MHLNAFSVVSASPRPRAGSIPNHIPVSNPNRLPVVEVWRPLVAPLAEEESRLGGLVHLDLAKSLVANRSGGLDNLDIPRLGVTDVQDSARYLAGSRSGELVDPVTARFLVAVRPVQSDARDDLGSAKSTEDSILGVLEHRHRRRLGLLLL